MGDVRTMLKRILISSKDKCYEYVTLKWKEGVSSEVGKKVKNRFCEGFTCCLDRFSSNKG